MACFWKNERNAVEVCLREVGNYVYAAYDGSEYRLVEVSKDLLGSITTAFSSPADPSVNGTNLYSKRGNVYQMRYANTNPSALTVYKGDAAGVFSEVGGAPSELGIHAWVITHVAGKLRAVSWPTETTGQFYESDDGETWSILPGSGVAPGDSGSNPGYYTVLGARLLSWEATYSDDGGTTWLLGAASPRLSGTYTMQPFLHSGSNTLMHSLRDLQVSADGATWTWVPLQFGSDTSSPKMAVSGTGLAVAVGTVLTGTYKGFMYSSDHGTTWTAISQTASGLPSTSTVYALFWDGVQFVGFVLRGDTFEHQIYTSPTGQLWTPTLEIPATVGNIIQIID